MPGYDRSGPMGAGPMTGGGRRRCNSAAAGTGAPYPARYGRGLGLRRGFGGSFGRFMGAGRGYGRRYGSYPTATGGFTPVEPADEMEMLKAEADYMKKSLEEINKRIQSLEQKPNGAP